MGEIPDHCIFKSVITEGEIIIQYFGGLSAFFRLWIFRQWNNFTDGFSKNYRIGIGYVWRDRAV